MLLMVDDFVVVADSGLMNRTNVSLLESGAYKYILGARIRNASEKTRQWNLSIEKYDGGFKGLQMGNARLIVGYSEKRAKKDKYSREKGVKR